jgi:hypothetical protein
MPPKESYYTIQSETHKVEFLGWYTTLAYAMAAAQLKPSVFPQMVVSESQLTAITKQALEFLI